MALLKLYLETSLFGFYFDETERNQSKREAVRTLFAQIQKGLFEAYVSPQPSLKLKTVPNPLERGI